MIVACPNELVPLNTSTVEPDAFVPLNTKAVSSVVCPLIRAPVTGLTSSVAAENTAVGFAVSTVTESALEAGLTLPVASVVLTVML